MILKDRKILYSAGCKLLNYSGGETVVVLTLNSHVPQDVMNFEDFWVSQLLHVHTLSS
jgi:hypothetical protein